MTKASKIAFKDLMVDCPPILTADCILLVFTNIVPRH